MRDVDRALCIAAQEIVFAMPDHLDDSVPLWLALLLFDLKQKHYAWMVAPAEGASR